MADENETSREACWYVAHTYSGYENKVKADLDKTVAKDPQLQQSILEVAVPLQDEVVLKNGVRKATQKKMFPGYVFIHMIMDDRAWYVVRNTRGVTGFVGPGSKPVPLGEDEMRNLGIGGDSRIVVDFEVGSSVMVVDGAWEGTIGAVRSVNESKQTVTISVDLFGRETPVELDFTTVRKI